MTKRRYAIGLAIMATVLSVCATAASSPAGKTTDQSSVEGKWVGRITGTPHGDMTMGLALKQEGNKVTGTLTTEHTGEMPVEGELNERALKLATGYARRNADRADRHTQRRWVAVGISLQRSG